MTTKTKHTPGPWRKEKEGVEKYFTGCIEINHPTEDICIALCYSTNPNMEADANLIAAAPKLLSACKMLVISLKELAEENKGYNNFITQGEKAITKAEGDQL